ncbi:MAG TPA: saccharopine dehydrogenase NADP-binding domain-containing protein, partial [Candidatus Nanoarchaeia archaeon]|nr:saccharopine dehydrogenase NADP-binding domain-containing protein [Candidatus Nanoarchaeia archaeon]
MDKQYDFVVLGATGIQGRIVTRDLLEKGYSVLLTGRNKKRVDELLNNYHKTEYKHLDVRNASNTKKIIRESGANIVVNCVESNWANHIIQSCLKAGVHYVDLGSEFAMTIEQLKLNDEIKKKQLTYIISSGSVPGIGNVMTQYAANKLDTIETIELGFAWASNIKKFVVPFSMQAIINEMLEPAQVLDNCEFKTVIPRDTTKRVRRRYVGGQVEFMVTHPETYTFYYYFKDKGL